MDMTKEDIEKLLQKDGICTIAVNGTDGYPLVVPLGYTYEDGKIYVTAGRARRKIIERDPRITVNVNAAPLGDACWVSISGKARITREKGRQRVRDLHVHSGLSEAETDAWMALMNSRPGASQEEPEMLEIVPEKIRSWKMKAPSFVRRAPVSTWLD